jgi:hypothetical protein
MTFIEIVALIGFILGSILHTVLSVFIVQRKNKKGSELVFLFLVISVAAVALWQCYFTFSIMLFGKNIPIINQLSSDFAYMGMGVVPSLLLHTAILFLLESGWKIKKKTMATIITIIYLPVIPFTLTAVRIIFFEEAHVLTSVSPFVKPFIIWLLFSIFTSAVISRILSAKVEEVEEQKFHFAIFWILIFITFLVSFTVLLEGRTLPYIGEYMVLATMLSSIFPVLYFLTMSIVTIIWNLFSDEVSFIHSWQYWLYVSIILE